MFYSQFILAKKGPLGTIWIAAHLERKLKKNQVADTDIGVSVDSILSPDVPIALRLSSHLLLGVVRIYSRKVNYLFHDCSEALLKIKQAFRSTAVDLPPEESTAPYHSITLPETFDLDDFELPDSAFQGNFVDHHVSTREQITLQDSVDAIGYSSLQFGLDERFGDGDASQIDLVLGENLFLDKDASLQNASIQLGTDGVVLQGQSSNMNVDGQNEHDGHNIPQSPRDLSDLLSDKHINSTVESSKKNDRSSLRQGYNIQTPDLNEVFFPDNHVDGPSAVPGYSTFAADDPPSPDLFECAEAPCTPGLMEEAIPASVQEIPVFSPQEKISPSNTMEEVDAGISTSRLEIKSPDGKKDSAPVVVVGMDLESAVNGQFVSSFNSSLTEQTKVQESSSELLTASDEVRSGQGPQIEVNVQNVLICNEVNNLPVHDNLEAALPDVACEDDLVASRCNIEASSAETPLNKSPHAVVPLTSNDNIIATGMTLDINCTSLENTSLGSNENIVVPGITLDTRDTSHENKAFTCNVTTEAPGIAIDINSVSPENKSLTSNDSVLAQSEALGTKDTSDENKFKKALASNDVMVTPEITLDVNRISNDSVLAQSEALGSKDTSDENKFNKALASNDVMVAPEITLDVNRISFDNIADSSVQGSQARADDGNTYLTSNTPNLCSHLYLRSCNSLMNKITNMLPSEASVEIVPDFSVREPQCVPEATPTPTEEILHAVGSSVELKGEANQTLNVTETIQTVHQNLGLVFPEPQLGANRPGLQESCVFSKGAQPNTSNLAFSSEYPEPEIMLFAPTSGVNFQNMFGQTTAELATEYPGSVEASNHRGQKRQLMDPSPVQQIGSSAKTSGLQRVRRNIAYVPDDDDLLASILVGRTPDLRVGPTPPPTTVASRKKPRLTRNIAVPKRKVLQDDTMVLHADAIRQQLISTEDIRRIRKKAPCTRPEIWMIQKSIMAEEMFGESLLTGISTNFNSLDTRCNANENPYFQIGDQQSDDHCFYAELSKELGHCESSQFVMESSGKIVAKPFANIPDRFDDGMQGPSTVSNISKDAIELDVHEIQEYLAPQQGQLRNNQTLEVVDIGIQGPSVASVTVEASTCKDAVEHFGQEGLESKSPQMEQPSNSQTIALSMTDINTSKVVGFEMPLVSAPFSQDAHEVLAVSGIEDTVIQQIDLNDSHTKENYVIGMQQEQESVHKLIQPSDNHAELAEGIVNFAGIASFEGVASAENATKCNDMALASLDDGKPDKAEDAHISNTSLDKSNTGDAMDSNCPQYFHADVGNIENGETLVSLLDRCLLKDASGLAAHPSPAIDPKNSCSSDMEIKSGELTDLANTSGNQATEEVKNGDLNVIPENELVAHRVSADEDMPNSVTNCQEDPQTSCPYQPDIGSENVPSAGENSGLHKCNLEGRLDVDSAPMDIGNVGDCDVSGRHEIGLDVESSLVDTIAARQSSVPSAVRDGSDLNECNVEGHLDLGSAPVDTVPSAGENSGLHKCNLEGGLDVDSAPMNVDNVGDCDVSGQHEIGLDVESSLVDTIAARQSSVPSAVGDGSDLNECNMECELDAGSAPVDTVTAIESNEFCSAVDDNDTEFLNMDDDAYFDEEADNDVPNFDESQSLENSGWSSRTRGVARFLKTYFDEESGRGRKIVSVDHLLAGKTRKEASRMFFETLVLTTRDYVHVEQASPFDAINIKPRPKLLKTEL